MKNQVEIVEITFVNLICTFFAWPLHHLWKLEIFKIEKKKLKTHSKLKFFWFLSFHTKFTLDLLYWKWCSFNTSWVVTFLTVLYLIKHGLVTYRQIEKKKIWHCERSGVIVKDGCFYSTTIWAFGAMLCFYEIIYNLSSLVCEWYILLNLGLH